MNRKRSVLFQIIIIVFIFAVIYLASILNSFAFRSNTVDAGAENTAAVLRLLKNCAEQGAAVLLVTHEQMAEKFADTIYVMRDGGILSLEHP